jgi:hypothetical protein
MRRKDGAGAVGFCLPQNSSVAVIMPLVCGFTYESPYDGLHRVIEHEIIHRHKDILKHLVVCLRPASYSQGLVKFQIRLKGSV